MPAQIVEPQRLGFPDQMTENTVALGQFTDHPDSVLVDADGDEMAQRLVLADDAERPEPGTDEIARRLHHTVQDSLQAQILGEGDHGRKQSPHLILGVQKFIGPGRGLTQLILYPVLQRITPHQREPLRLSGDPMAKAPAGEARPMKQDARVRL